MKPNSIFLHEFLHTRIYKHLNGLSFLLRGLNFNVQQRLYLYLGLLYIFYYYIVNITSKPLKGPITKMSDTKMSDLKMKERH